MLDDPLLAGRSAELIHGERINAEWAVHRVAEELIAALDGRRTLPARAKADMADVAGRLRRICGRAADRDWDMSPPPATRRAVARPR